MNAMTNERWQRIEQLYHAALARSVSERSPFLDEACGSDEALRREVESLLASDAQAQARSVPRLGRPADHAARS